MEKLIELLKEYTKKYNNSDLYYTFELDKYYWWLSCYDDIAMQDAAMVVCNKRFWFIEWLVENDKIDRDKVQLKIKGYWWFAIWCNWNHIECLLMLLAIQDEPIEFLCEILK